MEKEGSLGSLERVWAVRFRIQGRRVPTPLVQMITTLPERQQQHSGEGLLTLEVVCLHFSQEDFLICPTTKLQSLLPLGNP